VVRDAVKLAVAAAILLIAGGLIAAFASGYISAFRPGGTKDASQSVSYGGGGSFNAGAALPATPTPAPSAMPPAVPETPQAPAPWQMPGPPMQTGPFSEAPVQPGLPLQMPSGPVSGGTSYVPSARSPPSYAGPQDGSWSDSRVINDRPLPSPAAPPATHALPPDGQIIPQYGQPVAGEPGTSNLPYMPLSPYQAGWMQIIQRLISLLPLLFPGSGGLQPWWPQIA
jgi:hypothetical protein